ncbi:hypothetical protein NDU88_003707 [Pleurodeles waltl]|uniref:Uncharacterized protein n=1 Tax=Pleurodeles waltl TaxID=8319 RepID=A0AAV7NQF7_PLEWA|nr:hypothetical protein NDU88_003707 [Pleurodeles waltl]
MRQPSSPSFNHLTFVLGRHKPSPEPVPGPRVVGAGRAVIQEVSLPLSPPRCSGPTRQASLSLQEVRLVLTGRPPTSIREPRSRWVCRYLPVESAFPPSAQEPSSELFLGSSCARRNPFPLRS